MVNTHENKKGEGIIMSTTDSLPVLPGWFTEGIVSRFRAGISSVFLVHGDVTCLVPNPNGETEPKYPYIPLQELFARVFDEREMVIFYNIATGMRFLRPDMEKEFRKIAELGNSEETPKDPVAAAKADLAAKRQLPREPELCLPLIEKVLQKMDSVALIIDTAHFIAPESMNAGILPNERTHIARLRAWAQDARVKKKSNIVLLLTDLAVKMSGELRQISSRIATVFIPKPSSEERMYYIERLTKGSQEQQEIESQISALEKKRARAKGTVDTITRDIEELRGQLKKFPPHFEVSDDFDSKMFVNATQGMSLRQILEIFRFANQAERPIDLSLVKEKKKEMLNAEYGDVMEVSDPQWDLDGIGGLAKPKAFFALVLEAIRKGETRLIPQGITIMGPPGTGKTALVEALAKGAGFNFVKMKNARSMWVGQSEERTERQIQGLWALAPVIVMNDEADLGEANRDAPKGDSGVSERIMQAWMRFLSDPRIRGRIVMVNCTNRPDRMDAAMKRSGRSDDRIAILMPTEEERGAIFGVMFRRYKIPTTINDFSLFAQITKGLSGADIEAITLKSFRFAGEMGKENVDDSALREAIEDFIASASQADIDFMTLLAISESSSRRLLPANTEEIIREIKQRNLVPGGADLIAQIEARNIIPQGKFETVPSTIET
ncbi:MAG: ATP-binding protein [Parcubacteria group bacterium]|nr:ATP-binding protein [Parcubacteria group bacterium]